MSSIEDRHVSQVVPLREQLANATQNQPRLVTLVHRADDEDGIAFHIGGPKLLGFAIVVARNDGVRGAKNASCGAVVLLELDQCGIGEGGPEVQNWA